MLSDDCTESLSMHGIGRIFTRTSSNKKRVFWGVVFLTCISLAGLFICHLMVDYLQYEAELSYQSEINKSMAFPTVTICN